MNLNFQNQIRQGIPENLPPEPVWDADVPHAPFRTILLNAREMELAVANALRYFPARFHPVLAPEFARELKLYGRIYMHRFRPLYPMHARAIGEYPAKSIEAAAIMLMIQNNLDPAVAQFPHELITYGGNGTVFQNWAQYLLTMQYLSQMDQDQTLILYSGHPLGLFPSFKRAPRVVLTNGMMIPTYSSAEDYLKYSALGVTSYGQMTAGSFMYIGPQGIVHGTTITILNAARKYLNLPEDQDLSGKVFVSSGLGGMSGAQGKAGYITRSVTVIAEINPAALKKRYEQGWITEYQSDIDKLIRRVDLARKNREPAAIGYLGNIVDLWEAFAQAGVHIDLGSDQTSLHNPFSGGYYPAGYRFEQADNMMKADPAGFKQAVQASLRRQVTAINTMTQNGMHFWDYGNAFLLEASRAGAEGISKPDGSFTYPSYVEDIMGPICFDYGFGPFRWVCCSGLKEDLQATDKIAANVLRRLSETASPEVKRQLIDNLIWIEAADENRMVVGSKARILYSHERGRIEIALAFNQAIHDGLIKAPIVLGRDHHDVSGTDSPFRETANIYDGSSRTADMAVQNVIGDSFRGASWVSLHNGGGVGWGEVINGGFGMVIDGSEESAQRIQEMLAWDVNNGIARRAWARNPGAIYAIEEAMNREPRMKVTLPVNADPELIRSALNNQD